MSLLKRAPATGTESRPNLLNRNREIRPGSYRYKSALLDGASIAAAFAFSFLYYRYLENSLDFGQLALSLGIFAMISVVRSLVTVSWEHRFIVIFLETAAFMILFYSRPDWNLTATVALLMFIFLMWAEVASRSEISNSIELKFLRSARPHINKIITAVILMTALLYIPNLKSSREIISRGVYDGFFSASASALRYIYPGIDFDASIESVITGLTRSQLSEQKEFRGLSKEQQERTVEANTGATISNLQKNADIQFSVNESIRDIIYKFLVSTLNKWRASYGTWFFAIWVTAVFLIVRSIGFLFALVIGILSFFLFHLLIATGFLKFSAQPKMQEIVTYY